MLFCLLSVAVNAQEISNVNFQQVGKTIEVIYDLSGYESGTIELFYSTNDGKSYDGPLKAVTGAVGKNQKSGMAKKIVWDVLAEGIEFTGNIKFKVKYISGKYETIRDGKIYKTVKIGNQEWMAKNLAYKPSSGNYWAYNNYYKVTAQTVSDGYLYDWETANKVCPAGWHLPSDKEWSELTDYLGGVKVASTKMKSTYGWRDGGEGTNESGFNAFATGYRNYNGYFNFYGTHCNWWSSSEDSTGKAWIRGLYKRYGVNRNLSNKTHGFSVRCLRD